MKGSSSILGIVVTVGGVLVCRGLKDVKGFRVEGWRGASYLLYLFKSGVKFY